MGETDASLVTNVIFHGTREGKMLHILVDLTRVALYCRAYGGPHCAPAYLSKAPKSFSSTVIACSAPSDDFVFLILAPGAEML